MSHHRSLFGCEFSFLDENLKNYILTFNYVFLCEEVMKQSIFLLAGVHLTEVRPGRPSGECFVEVQSQEDVDEALKKDKENMGKRYIEGRTIKTYIEKIQRKFEKH